VESLIAIALPDMSVVNNDYSSNFDKVKGIYHMSPNDVDKSLQTEEGIYDIPYSHKGDCGPIYSVPANTVKKIYEEFAGKRFRKLLRKEIELVYLFSSIVPIVPCMLL